jgi:hypothetical protein
MTHEPCQKARIDVYVNGQIERIPCIITQVLPAEDIPFRLTVFTDGGRMYKNVNPAAVHIEPETGVYHVEK